ncbi:MAG: hypothetical protein K8H74_16275 [Notoacmeibacter sp.]|nr:hypothetical protein [Notoacmeibacter sp.]
MAFWLKIVYETITGCRPGACRIFFAGETAASGAGAAFCPHPGCICEMTSENEMRHGAAESGIWN